MNPNKIPREDSFFHLKISLREDPTKSEDLPPHVLTLRSKLLEFNHTITKRLRISTEEELQDVEDIFGEMRVPSYERIEIRAYLARHKLLALKDPNRGFAVLSDFLLPLAKEMRRSHLGPKEAPHTKFSHDYFKDHQMQRWGLFEGLHAFCKTDRGDAPCPCPQWAASYPIYDLDPNEGAPAPGNPRRGAYIEDKIIENFSLKTLHHLARHGLEFDASGLFRNQSNGTTITLLGPVCFPWLVAELREFLGFSPLYSEAANAAVAAVMMFQRLAMHAPKQEQDQHIPPVIAITVVKNILRVWITHWSSSSQKYNMDCIWKGDTTLLFDRIQLQAILDNAHTWAMHELRPWISRYIDQWKARYPRDGDPMTQLPQTTQDQISDTASSIPTDRDDLAAPKDSTSPHDREAEEKTSTVSFRAILQTEHEALLGQFKQILQDSLAATNFSQPRHHSRRSVGVQTRDDDDKAPGDALPMSRKPRDIFKMRVMLPYHGKKICVKLPNVSSSDLAASKPGLVRGFPAPKPPSMEVIQNQGISSKTQVGSPQATSFKSSPPSSKFTFEPLEGTLLPVAPKFSNLKFNPNDFLNSTFDFRLAGMESELSLRTLSGSTNAAERSSIDRTSRPNELNSPKSKPEDEPKDGPTTPTISFSKEDYDNNNDDGWEDMDESS
ncbi:hypothetical protein EDB81DRAFT_945022 [Dactylonectria macrodidyma]|uniref:Uncharacterized protein n=1 Tax=Dactylonectria macrodidyma TaxID=307937 RepID=A0A9P9F9E8_9HYPO|nr:hypothetical protein EDB81DRAFT_945022 [Dactylonectria macrodidyma]